MFNDFLYRLRSLRQRHAALTPAASAPAAIPAVVLTRHESGKPIGRNRFSQESGQETMLFIGRAPSRPAGEGLSKASFDDDPRAVEPGVASGPALMPD